VPWFWRAERGVSPPVRSLRSPGAYAPRSPAAAVASTSAPRLICRARPASVSEGHPDDSLSLLTLAPFSLAATLPELLATIAQPPAKGEPNPARCAFEESRPPILEGGVWTFGAVGWGPSGAAQLGSPNCGSGRGLKSNQGDNGTRVSASEEEVDEGD